VPAHRGIEIDRPNWRRSPECRDTDVVSGFSETAPAFSTRARNDLIEDDSLCCALMRAGCRKTIELVVR